MDDIQDRGGAREHDVHGRSGAHDPELRLSAVLLASGLRPALPPVGVESHSNDTYLIEDSGEGATVLRICYRGDIERLVREAEIGRYIPPEVGYPEILSSGRAVANDWPLTWSVSRRLSGSTLMEAWPGLTDDERRQATRSASDALRALHAWRPPVALATRLTWPTTAELTTPELVIGASIHPVPIERVDLLIAALRTQDGVDRKLVDAARSAIEPLRHLSPGVDDPSIGGLIHGDLHLSNIWWSDRGEAGLIDLEWVRFAPPWMDLARLRENADADEAEGLDAHVEFLRWLAVDYPELFAVDQFQDRIRLLCLAFQVRQSLIWGAAATDSGIAPDHPLRMLRRLLQASTPES